MHKKTLLIFFVTIFLNGSASTAFASTSTLDDMGLGAFYQTSPAEQQLPNPDTLNPQWWHYFEEDPTELAQKVSASYQQLQTQIKALPVEEQELAAPILNQLFVNFNALITAKKQQPKEIPAPQPFRQAYTLEQQLELNHKIRKLKIEKKNEVDELDSVKNRTVKAQKRLDDLLVSYLAMDQSPKKFLAGLEIMAQRTALGVAEENLPILENRIEVQQSRLNQLQKELILSKTLLTVSNYDENHLEHEIRLAESKLENGQTELARAESNSLNLLGDTASDKSLKYLLTQKVTHASVNKALAWTKVAFDKLKYNLIMHINNRFEESHHDMRKTLESWKNNLDSLSRQLSEWKKNSLREQDRVRQDYAILTTQSDNSETNKLMRLNQTRRQESLESLSTLQILEDEIFNTTWLIDRLEDYIQTHSSFIERWWMGLNSFAKKVLDGLIAWLNYSLFKVSGIPITLLTLLRIVLILTITFILSKVVRTALISFGNSQGNMTESTLYTLGRLGHYFILCVGGLIAIFSIGLDFSNLVIITGALTFGIGFGLQSFATNFLCGLRILFERKLKIGDYIELESGLYGKITEIHVQNTVICTSDGREVIVPNSELIGHQLINWTMNNDNRRLHIPFQTSYNTDKDFVRQIVVAAAKRVPCALSDKEPQVWLVKFGDVALEFELVVWVNYKSESFTDSKEADFLWEIETALRAHSIELPMPQQLLHFQHVPNFLKENVSALHHPPIPPILKVPNHEKNHGQIGVAPTRSLP